MAVVSLLQEQITTRSTCKGKGQALFNFFAVSRHYRPNRRVKDTQSLIFLEWLSLLFSLLFDPDDLELVDWTGSILRDDKRGAIPESTRKIPQQLNIEPKHWCYLSKNFESQFKSLVGTSYHIKQACEQLGKQWVHGIRACEKFFPT
jgi:hypothetical protein